MVFVQNKKHLHQDMLGRVDVDEQLPSLEASRDIVSQASRDIVSQVSISIYYWQCHKNQVLSCQLMTLTYHLTFVDP